MRVKRRRHKSLLNIADKCYYCERNFNSDGYLNAGRKTIDHIVPLSKNGLDQKENVVICCQWCNDMKGNLSLNQFFKKIKEVKKTGSVMPIEQLNLIQNNIINLRKNEDYQWVKRFSEKKTITSK